MTAADLPTDLHCRRRKHGVLTGDVLEIHCRFCKRYHRWSVVTGLQLPDRDEADLIAA